MKLKNTFRKALWASLCTTLFATFLLTAFVSLTSAISPFQPAENDSFVYLPVAFQPADGSGEPAPQPTPIPPTNSDCPQLGPWEGNLNSELMALTFTVVDANGTCRINDLEVKVSPQCVGFRPEVAFAFSEVLIQSDRFSIETSDFEIDGTFLPSGTSIVGGWESTTDVDPLPTCTRSGVWTGQPAP